MRWGVIALLVALVIVPVVGLAQAKGPLLEADENGQAILTEEGKEAMKKLPLEKRRENSGWGMVPLGKPGTLKTPQSFRNRVILVDRIVRKDGLVLRAEGVKAQIAVGGDSRVRKLGEEIAWHLSEMCGEGFSVVASAAESEATPVVELRMLKGGELGRSEIRREGSRIIVAGENTGLSHAVTYFLEALGCRYLWPGRDGKVIPKRDRIVLPEISLDYVPQLKVREIRDGKVHFGNGYLARFGIEEKAYQALTQAAECDHPGNRGFFAWHGINDGRNLKGAYSWGHYFGNYWQRFGKEHEEWFALQPNGFREQKLYDRPERPTFCYASRGLVAQAAKDILADFEKSPALVAHSICLPDGGHTMQCMCEECRRLDPPNAPAIQLNEGGPDWKSYPYVSLTDRVYTYFNRIAEEVTAKRPGAKFCCYAYSYYQEPPMAVRPHPSLVILSVAGWYTRVAQRDSARKTLAAWSSFGNEMMWRPNSLLAWKVNLPQNTARPMFEDLELFKVNGVIGSDISAMNHQWANKGFMCYMIAKAHLNPDHLSYDALARDYCQSGFGKAADKVLAYFTALERLGDRVGADMKATANDYAAAFDVEAYAALLGEARKAAEGDAAALGRIAFLEKALDAARWEKRLAAAWVAQDYAAICAIQKDYSAYLKEHAEENVIAVNPLIAGFNYDSPNMKTPPAKWRK